jgi:hypothetical protein
LESEESIEESEENKKKYEENKDVKEIRKKDYLKQLQLES